MMFDASGLDLFAVFPVLCLVGFALLALLLDLCLAKDSDETSYRTPLVVMGCVFSWISTWVAYHLQDTALGGLIYLDAYGVVLSTIILVGTLLTVLLHRKKLQAQGVESSTDVDVLLLFAAAGALVMVTAGHLFVLFIGFELLSLSLYVLTGAARGEPASSEGALRYFILGAFSSAFLLYGMVLVYGATGSMELSRIALSATSDNALLLCGLSLLFFGFGFKVSLVPFHFWTPDVYHGAPISIAGFMAVVVKTAAFGSFLRILWVSFEGLSDVWIGTVWVLSALTMTVGNLAALKQESIKRLLAYSSIAHAGYALMGFLVLGTNGAQATLFYLLVYSLMTFSAFGVVLLVTAGSEAQYERDDIRSFSGVGWSHPFLGLAMVVALLSLAGMPPLAGFVGKFYLFTAALQGGYLWLAIIAVVNSLISLYYYLRVLVFMYFSGPRKMSWSLPEKVAFVPAVAVAISVFGVLYIGLNSEQCLGIVEYAVDSLR